jgi:filamentous hemagglutinin family protein
LSHKSRPNVSRFGKNRIDILETSNFMNWCRLFPLLSLAITITPWNAQAQIIPDNTLGGENSSLTPINNLTDRIDGGATRGTNLFHSFQEFSIPEGRAAYFNNPQAIQTIFSRVTGNNPSLLFGTLGVLGNANLFLINPRGIIFGPNATLDMRG